LFMIFLLPGQVTISMPPCDNDKAAESTRSRL
jgi:hypothetical protein